MQVKKFEAKSMKEALELVKIHLGPEAIILSAKDTHKGFGLLGEKSVEVTAAVTEETLRKKKLAESRIREDLRDRFQQIPAARQKEFINRVYNTRQEVRRELATVGGGREPRRTVPQAGPSMSAEDRAELRGLKYVEIDDEAANQGLPDRTRGRDRVRRAAEAARMASQSVIQEPVRGRQRIAPPTSSVVATAPGAPEVAALEAQLRELKSIVEKFQNVPQIPLGSHPGAEQGLPYELSSVYQKLCSQGLQPSYVASVLKKAEKEMDPEALRRPAMVDAWAVRHFLDTVEASPNPLQGRYHVFLGSAGQGKTSALVRFASHLVLRERRTIAIISLDPIKVGAADQLKIFAQILNVPFAIVRDPSEWSVAEQKLGRVQHILVDSPGFSMRSMEDADWLKRMLPPAELNRTLHYVQAATARDEDAIDLAGRYQMVGIHDVIFTRMDETSRHGLIVNFQREFGVPVHSFTTGPRIPEDFEIASKERIVDFIFKLTRLQKEDTP